MKSSITILIFLLTAGMVNGHGLGQSFEKEVNGYLMDIGYDAPGKVLAGDAIRFDFNLWTKDKVDIAPFDHVWVRITPKEKGMTFAGFLYRPEFLLTGMSYAFQLPGEYELTVRFLDKDDKNLAEASFPLIVIEEEGSGDPEMAKIAGSGVAGLLIGGFVSYLILNRKKVQQQ